MSDCLEVCGSRLALSTLVVEANKLFDDVPMRIKLQHLKACSALRESDCDFAVEIIIPYIGDEDAVLVPEKAFVCIGLIGQPITHNGVGIDPINLI